MANEATKVELFGHNSAGDVISGTISSSVAVPKGTLMVLSASPRTIAAHSAKDEVFVGVASAEKDVLDTSTTLGCYQNGVFDFACSGAVTDGAKLALSDTANRVIASAALTDMTKYVGMALADSSASGGRVVARVNK